MEYAALGVLVVALLVRYVMREGERMERLAALRLRGSNDRQAAGPAWNAEPTGEEATHRMT